MAFDKQAWERDRPQRNRAAYHQAYDRKRSEQYQVERGECYRQRAKCHQGHLLAAENIYIRPRTGKRECLTCKNARQRQYRLNAMEPEKRAAWLLRNRERIRRYGAARRARELGAFVEAVDPAVVYARDVGACGLCGEQVDPSDFHVDHVVPLVLGGLHEYVNSQLAHPVCNLHKGAKLVMARANSEGSSQAA